MSTPASPAWSVSKSGWDTGNLHHLLHRSDAGPGGAVSADLDRIGFGYQAHRANNATASHQDQTLQVPGPSLPALYSTLTSMQHWSSTNRRRPVVRAGWGRSQEAVAR